MGLMRLRARGFPLHDYVAIVLGLLFIFTIMVHGRARALLESVHKVADVYLILRDEATVAILDAVDALALIQSQLVVNIIKFAHEALEALHRMGAIVSFLLVESQSFGYDQVYVAEARRLANAELALVVLGE